MTIKDTLRTNLRTLKQLGLIKSNQALAEKIGSSSRTVNQLFSENEDTNPRIDTVELVAKALGIETWMLLSPNFPFHALKKKKPLNIEEEDLLLMQALKKTTPEQRKTIRTYASFMIESEKDVH